MKYEIPINDVSIEKNGNIYFKNIGIVLNKKNFTFFLKYYNKYFKKLFLTGLITFKIENDDIILVYGDLRFIVKSEVELWIFEEIYFENVYNFNINKDIEVFDIGMNVGFASLYFASKKNVQKIYSFEPFEETYKEATINFNLNPTIKAKILSHCFGLGDSNRSEIFSYDPLQKGNMGIIHSASNKKEQSVSVQIKNTSEILQNIIKGSNNPSYLAKIDCEGAEYEIIDSLFKSGLLKKIDYFIIEWHKVENFRKKIEEMQYQFIDSGFIFYLKGTFSYSTGMIYAQKIK